ncbi:hypothetical protein AAFF_G00317320 [Aldrovandia affinis]|uniref:Uncharacterized protein n=1 Tax=Aldrovandia affinis TaxID=143900 RepID=A0AAD7R7R3_9TELE|nr:hypothetical protein AAFF_G00317320 [Aldrovandia affinis]
MKWLCFPPRACGTRASHVTGVTAFRGDVVVVVVVGNGGCGRDGAHEHRGLRVLRTPVKMALVCRCPMLPCGPGLPGGPGGSRAHADPTGAVYAGGLG